MAQRAKGLRVQAEYKLGVILKKMPKATAGRPPRIGSNSEPNKSAHIPTLADMGIDKKTSMRAMADRIRARLRAGPATSAELVAALHLDGDRALQVALRTLGRNGLVAHDGRRPRTYRVVG